MVLRCPAYLKCDEEDVGYNTITCIIMGFDRVVCLSKTINLVYDGVGIEVTFRQHGVKLHNSCRLQFKNTKLLRAEKRKSHIFF